MAIDTIACLNGMEDHYGQDDKHTLDYLGDALTAGNGSKMRKHAAFAGGLYAVANELKTNTCAFQVRAGLSCLEAMLFFDDPKIMAVAFGSGIHESVLAVLQRELFGNDTEEIRYMGYELLTKFLHYNDQPFANDLVEQGCVPVLVHHLRQYRAIGASSGKFDLLDNYLKPLSYEKIMPAYRSFLDLPPAASACESLFTIYCLKKVFDRTWEDDPIDAGIDTDIHLFLVSVLERDMDGTYQDRRINMNTAFHQEQVKLRGCKLLGQIMDTSNAFAGDLLNHGVLTYLYWLQDDFSDNDQIQATVRRTFEVIEDKEEQLAQDIDDAFNR